MKNEKESVVKLDNSKTDIIIQEESDEVDINRGHSRTVKEIRGPEKQNLVKFDSQESIEKESETRSQADEKFIGYKNPHLDAPLNKIKELLDQCEDLDDDEIPIKDGQIEFRPDVEDAEPSSELPNEESTFGLTGRMKAE